MGKQKGGKNCFKGKGGQRGKQRGGVLKKVKNKIRMVAASNLIKLADKLGLKIVGKKQKGGLYVSQKRYYLSPGQKHPQRKYVYIR